MLSEEERKAKTIKIHDMGHFIQQLKERGKTLFKKESAREMYIEIERHLFNCSRCIFAKDERTDVQSNYVAIFLTDAGGFTCIPCFVDDNSITMFTIKDILKDDYPNWFISKYQEMGKIRNLAPLTLKFEDNRKV